MGKQTGVKSPPTKLGGLPSLTFSASKSFKTAWPTKKQQWQQEAAPNMAAAVEEWSWGK